MVAGNLSLLGLPSLTREWAGEPETTIPKQPLLSWAVSSGSLTPPC